MSTRGANNQARKGLLALVAETGFEPAPPLVMSQVSVPMLYSAISMLVRKDLNLSPSSLIEDTLPA